ncbi:MAG: glycerate kinase [Clostridia bacterium]|nr:glycerate kinase [Clostridia bacterium]MBR1704280.1 glycerate kinase [Clostridia bacterium]
MKLLFASDSFKGSLSSAQTVELLTEAAHEVFSSACECIGVPVADGGEGTVDAVVAARGGQMIPVPVHGPQMDPVEAMYGILPDGAAILEMAAASGLTLVPEDRRDPLLATTYGTGELVKAALDRGCREIVLAIGGSATNDGGMGFARALGVKFYDEEGNELLGRGEDLGKALRMEVTGLDPRVRETKFTVMCDVTNPLTGPEGATRTFGAQKGATPEMQAELEAGMENYRHLLMDAFGVDPNDTPGTGAAGGLGAALLLFCDAEMKSGIDTVLDLVGFDDLLNGVGLVITGEGRTDWQSAYGKVLAGVGKRCAVRGVPAVALSGSLGDGWEQVLDRGITRVVTTAPPDLPLQEAMARAEELYYRAALELFRSYQGT